MSSFLQLTSWLSSAGGGIPPVIQALTAEFRRQEMNCMIAGVASPMDMLSAFPSDWPVFAGRIIGPAAFGYSPELARHLRSLVQKDDVIHVHGLWMFPGLLARKLADEAKAIRVVSPHGMVEPWALNNSRWKKKVAAFAFENTNLHTSSCLHALCVTEAESFRHYGLKRPITIIPNGVDIPNCQIRSEDNQKPPWERSTEKSRKILLYLGRIHPKKGLTNLLLAWKTALQDQVHDPWILVIAGWDQGGYEQELRMLAVECDIQDTVRFIGPQFGEAKSTCYRNCDAFVLPSFSEGLPMVVLEAWAYAKPVLITPECNLSEAFVLHAALRIEPKVDSIVKGLRQLFEMSDRDRHTMGQHGIALVKRNFTWPKVAAQMRSVYEWLLGGGSKPECVVDK